MRMMNIASGSSGNVTYVGSEHTHLLIDSGVSRKKILEGLKRLDLTLGDIDAILISHEHSDHISSLGVLERTREIPIYATSGTANGILKCGFVGENSGLFHNIDADSSFVIGDIMVTALKINHDAADPVCFRFDEKKSSCAVVTDLGEPTSYLKEHLTGLSALILEANHDIRMLETGPYPYPLKMRIGGRKGHLSNESSGKFLSEILHDDMKHIALGHLSEKNNTADLALLTAKTEIEYADNIYHAADFAIDIAHQTTGTEIYNF